MPIHGRGPQVVLEGYARNVARGAAGRTMRENIAAMDALVIAGQVADGNAVDGSSRTGGQPYDVVVAQFPHETTTAYEIPAPLLQGLGGGSRGYYLPDYILPGDPDATAGMNRALAAIAAAGGGALQVPTGIYTLSSPITAAINCNITIMGDGKVASMFVIAHAGVGIDISENAYFYYVTIRDLGFSSSSPSGSLAGIRIKYPDGLFTTHVSVARSHVTLDNLEFTSNGGTTIAGNFYKGIMLYGAWAPRLTNCNFWSYAGTATEGICLLDIALCIDVRMSLCMVTHGDCLVYSSDYFEGCYIVYGAAIGANYAVRMNQASQLKGGSAGIAWGLLGGEYATLLGGVNLYLSNQNFTTMCHFGTYSTTNGWTAYILNGCSFGSFTSDQIDAPPAAVATAGAVLTGASIANKWIGTKFNNIDFAYNFGASTSQTTVDCYFHNGTPLPVVDNGTANRVQYTNETDGGVTIVGEMDLHAADRQIVLGIDNVAGATSHLRVSPGVGGAAPSLNTESPAGTGDIGMLLHMEGAGGLSIRNSGSGSTAPGTLAQILPSSGAAQTSWPVLQPGTAGLATITGGGAANSSMVYAALGTGTTFLGQTTNGAVKMQTGLRRTFVDGVTAQPGGGQANATALTNDCNTVQVVTTAGDSVKLPATGATTTGRIITVTNSSPNALQVFGTGTDTINIAAAATGVSIPARTTALFQCTITGRWWGGLLTLV